MKSYRIFVEKYPEFRVEAESLLRDLNANLNLSLDGLRLLNVYDLFGFSDELLEKSRYRVFGEVVTDAVTDSCDLGGNSFLAVECLPGQFDQRAASAVDCVRLIDPSAEVKIKSSKLLIFPSKLPKETMERIRRYYINAVESREKDLRVLDDLESAPVKPVPVLDGFREMEDAELDAYCKKNGLAMNADDLREVVEYFRREGRDPFETELRILDTYWSDHCRHTTFTTELENITVEESFVKDEIEGTLKEAVKAWLDSYGCHNEGETTKQISANLIAELEKAQLAGQAGEEVKYLVAHKEHIAKKTVWIVGGDGWAYDIGYGGLDHVMATTENFNVLVIDNEVYANTGGQSSKATPKGAVAQFAAAGRRTNKKDLGRIMIGYGHIYVASVSMGANPAQMLKAMKEAEAYDGPSIIIGYAPCINHGLKAGQGSSQLEQKRAVDAGYWQLYRYNPDLKDQGKNPFSLDSKEPKANFRDFLMGEVRFASLQKVDPDQAEALYQKTEKDARDRYESYVRTQKAFDLSLDK